MFVAFVIYNLGDDYDLDMIGCSDTSQGAIDLLKKRACIEEDEFNDDWVSDKTADYKITTDEGREYGYEHISYVKSK